MTMTDRAPRFLYLVVAVMALVTACVIPTIAGDKVMVPENEDKDNVLIMTLKTGPVLIRLLPDVAPKHVTQIKTLVRQGFYDGIVFHRVIEGFVAQTGDPTGTGMGGSELPNIPAEFSSIPFERGVLGMARSADPNSGNSQFYIAFDDIPHLNGQYTVFGKVIDGMEHVDAIARGEPPANPDKMISVKVASDE